jgi:hypothetical protein
VGAKDMLSLIFSSLNLLEKYLRLVCVRGQQIKPVRKFTIDCEKCEILLVIWVSYVGQWFIT